MLYLGWSVMYFLVGLDESAEIGCVRDPLVAQQHLHGYVPGQDQSGKFLSHTRDADEDSLPQAIRSSILRLHLQVQVPQLRLNRTPAPHWHRAFLTRFVVFPLFSSFCRDFFSVFGHFAKIIGKIL